MRWEEDQVAKEDRFNFCRRAIARELLSSKLGDSMPVLRQLGIGKRLISG